jgi:hypothetical protein
MTRPVGRTFTRRSMLGGVNEAWVQVVIMLPDVRNQNVALLLGGGGGQAM